MWGGTSGVSPISMPSHILGGSHGLPQHSPTHQAPSLPLIHLLQHYPDPIHHQPGHLSSSLLCSLDPGPSLLKSLQWIPTREHSEQPQEFCCFQLHLMSESYPQRPQHSLLPNPEYVPPVSPPSQPNQPTQPTLHLPTRRTLRRKHKYK